MWEWRLCLIDDKGHVRNGGRLPAAKRLAEELAEQRVERLEASFGIRIVDWWAAAEYVPLPAPWVGTQEVA